MERKVVAAVRQFMSGQEGLEQVEYAIATALIIAAVAVALTALNMAIGVQMDEVRAILGF